MDSTSAGALHSASNNDFSTVFAPLAHHLFPDGYPHDNDHDDDDEEDDARMKNGPDDAHPLERWWPPAPETRAAIPAYQALSSLSLLNQWAASRGMTTDQQQVACMVVCALTTSSKQQRTTIVANSPLRQGRHIRSLLRSILPRKGHPVSSRIVRQLVTRVCHPILPPKANRQQQLASVVKNTNDNLGGTMTTSAVLQFLTLVVRCRALTLEARRTMDSLYHILFACALDPDTCVDAVRLLCLITRKSHFRVHRAQRLRLAYAALQPQAQQPLDKDNSNSTAALALLLQLYARYDPRGFGKFQIGTRTTSSRRRNTGDAQVAPSHRPMGHGGANTGWFSIPDPVWERRFSAGWCPQPNNAVADDDDENLCPRKRMRTTIGKDISRNPEDDDMPSVVVATMDRLLETNDTTSFDAISPSFPSRSLQASHLLQDQSLWNIRSLLSGESVGDAATHPLVDAPAQSEKEGGNLLATTVQDLIRIQVCLPYLLQDEWYHRSTKTRYSGATATYTVAGHESDGATAVARNLPSASLLASLSPTASKLDSLDQEIGGEDSSDDRDSDDHSSSDEVSSPVPPSPKATISATTVLAPRIRVLRALAAMATQHGTLPPEAIPIIRQDILAAWDGTEEWGAYLCWDILPVAFSSSVRNSRLPPSFSELKNQFLLRLEPLFLYGPPTLQYSIVAGSLALLLRRMSVAVSSIRRERNAPLVHPAPPHEGRRTDSSLARPQAQPTRLLKEFIQWTETLLLQGFLIEDSSPRSELLAAASLAFFKAVCSDVAEYCSLVVTPSPALLYRLLLSRSQAAIDGACQLLVDYKGSFQKLKQRQNASNIENSTTQPMQVEGLDRVTVFNCFVWDFCSVLWRCSPLPSSIDEQVKRSRDDPSALARSMSILFTDIHPDLLAWLNAKPSSAKVASSLSITHGAVFAQYASDFLERKGVSSPSPDMLQGSLKREYLDYLKNECGMQGLYAFLTAFVASLAKRQEKRREAQEKVSAP